jgi:hypothetical protein
MMYTCEKVDINYKIFILKLQNELGLNVAS